MKFSERFTHPYVIKPADIEAGIDGDSINMGRLHSACFKFAFGAITGDAVLKFYVGAAEGAKTTAVAFSYRLGAAIQGAATGDQLGAVTAVAATGLTLVAATYTTKQMLIEFDSQVIPDSTPWLTVEVSAAAAVLLASCTAICDARDISNIPATVIK